MGYYDGLGGTSCEASSYHLAKSTQTPVLLVVNAKGASLSLAAMLNGFLQFYPNSQIAAVLLNHCSEGLYHMLKPMIEERTRLKVLGYLPYMPECSIPSRHLGLVNAQEIANLRAIIDKLAHALLQTVDWQTLFSIMEEAPPLQALPLCEPPVVHNQPVVAVARDEAFCFYYREIWICLQVWARR